MNELPTVAQLLAILKTAPGGVSPVVKGRRNMEITVSLPKGKTIPKGWSPCSAPGWMYPEGTVRVKWNGEPNG